MCFSTSTQCIWTVHLENITRDGEAQGHGAGLKATIQYAIFFLRQRVSAYTLPIIHAICNRKMFSCKAVILTSVWPFVHLATSKKLLRNWRGV